MHMLLVSAGPAVPIRLVTPATLKSALDALGATAHVHADVLDYGGKPGAHLVVPAPDGRIAAVLFGVEPAEAEHADPFLIGKLPGLLPAGTYAFAEPLAEPHLATLAWIAGQYRFTRYKEAGATKKLLVLPAGVDAARVTAEAEAIELARDLVNTPANDLGPAELEAAIRALGARHGAAVSSVVGAALIEKNFPMIHAVGMGSPREPRLVDLVWGDPAHPKVTLVGKGVCFDTGGLDIKPDTAMLLMKKDMGGAAAAIGLAHMIMSARLPVRLRLLVPAVENAVSGQAFRPGDVFLTRKGLTVEIGNTDAEGRLVLCDALALADDEEPALVADFATLTGAARVALGAELPPIYSHDQILVDDLVRIGRAIGDPLWPLPLWLPYAKGLDSKVADMNNIASGGMAGSITAALYLRAFVEKARANWLHVDLYAWVPAERPGRPVGGEFQAGRALFRVIEKRFGRA